MRSCLPARLGTQKEWMTSSPCSSIRTFLPTGIWISFAVFTEGRDPEDKYSTSHHHIFPRTLMVRSVVEATASERVVKKLAAVKPVIITMVVATPAITAITICRSLRASKETCGRAHSRLRHKAPARTATASAAAAVSRLAWSARAACTVSCPSPAATPTAATASASTPTAAVRSAPCKCRRSPPAARAAAGRG